MTRKYRGVLDLIHEDDNFLSPKIAVLVAQYPESVPGIAQAARRVIAEFLYHVDVEVYQLHLDALRSSIAALSTRHVGRTGPVSTQSAICYAYLIGRVE